LGRSCGHCRRARRSRGGSVGWIAQRACDFFGFQTFSRHLTLLLSLSLRAKFQKSHKLRAQLCESLAANSRQSHDRRALLCAIPCRSPPTFPLCAIPCRLSAPRPLFLRRRRHARGSGTRSAKVPRVTWGSGWAKSVQTNCPFRPDLRNATVKLSAELALGKGPVDFRKNVRCRCCRAEQRSAPAEPRSARSPFGPKRRSARHRVRAAETPPLPRADGRSAPQFLSSS